MTSNWLDLALAQLGNKYYSPGAFVAFIFNSTHVHSHVKSGKWSADLIDLTYDVYELNTIENTNPGDLLFWGIPEQPYTTGIYVGGGQFIAVDANDKRVKMQMLNTNWLPTFTGTVF